jgi:hypothetical protein
MPCLALKVNLLNGWVEGVAPTVAAPTGNVWLEHEKRRKFPPETLKLIREWLLNE